MRRGVRVRILTDKNRLKSGGCAGTYPALLAALEWNVEVRFRQPSSGCMSAQHEKSWIFDNKVIATGSFNLTKNSVLSCEEALVITNAVSVVDDMRAHFSRLWADSEVLTIPHLSGLIAHKQGKRTGKSGGCGSASSSSVQISSMPSDT